MNKTKLVILVVIGSVSLCGLAGLALLLAFFPSARLTLKIEQNNYWYISVVAVLFIGALLGLLGAGFIGKEK